MGVHDFFSGARHLMNSLSLPPLTQKWTFEKNRFLNLPRVEGACPLRQNYIKWLAKKRCRTPIPYEHASFLYSDGPYIFVHCGVRLGVVLGLFGCFEALLVERAGVVQLQRR